AASAASAAAPAAAPAPPKPAQLTRAAQKELQKIERRLDRIGTEESALHADMAEHATDFARVADLDRRLRELTAERDTLETRWLELSEGL
ncbi:ABC transporter C-terminal domain-containing protein, partial [Streptomyces sp. YIM 98790]|uniref:ABC transporter C-terminal domain-containing protein n=1 Tax=Streptomyces sp. YIM 98790 TaxID=2689077 RepID=UPI001FB6BB1F